MSVTSFDVARLAKVSQSTVSRALRGDPSIAAATVRRVQAAAAQLNYVPSERARDLSTGNTRRIGMLVDLDNPLWALLVGSLHDMLAERGYRLTLLAGHGDEQSIEASLAGGGIDGAIVSTVSLHSRLPQLLARRGVPTVLLHRYTDDSDVDASVADNHAGGALAARMLLDAGHTRIGALLGPADTSTGRDREAGFREQLDAAGVQLRPEWVRRGAFDFAHGRASLPALIHGRDAPTALLCANDSIAFGALDAAFAGGLRVPEDVALTGFDDLAEASWASVSLTTVAVPFADMLRSALSLLIERIGGHTGSARRVVHGVTPVLRRTHGCLPPATESPVVDLSRESSAT